MFWGLVVQPNKKYSQTVRKPFHVSHAVLDVGSTTNDGDVQLILTNDNVSYILCILRKSQTVQVPLDLIFSDGDEISFLSVGGTIHLTGYLQDDFETGDFDSSDVDDEAPSLVPSPKMTKEDKKSKQQKKAKKIQEVGESSSDDDAEDDDDEGEEDASEDDDDDDEEMEDVDDEEESDDEEEEEEAKPPPKKQKLGNSEALNGMAKKDKSNKEKKAEKSLKTKTLLGGVKIEDIRVGKGAEAKPGKKVQVYYEGRIKGSNKVFDKSLSGPGFKFVLNRGEVIKGWDVGVVGMKVGSKRRITCPPNMAYGAKGQPPVIPGNSTLIFDVELRGVN